MDIKLYNIVAIVNEGYSDIVISVAKDNGARGATIIPGNSSVTGDAMKLYGIGVKPEKEIILILVNEDIVENILSSLYDKAGSNTDAMGVFFTLPVAHASENILNQYKQKKN